MILELLSVESWYMNVLRDISGSFLKFILWANNHLIP